MEDLYYLLKMSYADVKVISRQAGMYFCSDKNPNEQGVLYICNEVSPKGMDLLSMSFGKSWVAMLYKDRDVDILDKHNGKVIHTFTNVSYMSKQNIYDDNYSYLLVKYMNDEKCILIIDNRNAKIIHIYNNVFGIAVDKLKQYELLIKLHDASGKIMQIGVDRHMRGVVLYHET